MEDSEAQTTTEATALAESTTKPEAVGSGGIDVAGIMAYISERFATGVPSFDELEMFVAEVGSADDVMKILKGINIDRPTRVLGLARWRLANKVDATKDATKVSTKAPTCKKKAEQPYLPQWYTEVDRRFGKDGIIELAIENELVPETGATLHAALTSAGMDIQLTETGRFAVHRSTFNRFKDGGTLDAFTRLQCHALKSWCVASSEDTLNWSVAWRELWEILFCDDFPLRWGMTLGIVESNLDAHHAALSEGN